MNLVILSGDSPVSAYLYQELASRGVAMQVVHVSGDSRPSAGSRWTKLRKRPFHTAATSLRLRFFTRHWQFLERRISGELFGRCAWPTPAAAVRIAARDINSPESAALLTSLQPDLLLVCGAPVLRPEILSIPSKGAVNLHFGIAPHYRGQHTLFWAWYRGDWDNIGFTLHCLDPGIDTGNILARGYPELTRSETEATLWAKCTRLAAPVIVELVQAAEKSPLLGMPQPPGGHLFYGRQRTLRHQLKYLWKQWTGKPHLPERPSQVERHFGPLTDSQQDCESRTSGDRESSSC